VCWFFTLCQFVFWSFSVGTKGRSLSPTVCGSLHSARSKCSLDRLGGYSLLFRQPYEEAVRPLIILSHSINPLPN
jgi:hypothetical protein